MEGSTFEIRLLGRFVVLRDGEEVPAAAFGGRLPRRLVRVLAARRGEHLSKDALVEALWPQRPPSDPVRNLEVLVSRARRALGEPSLLLTDSGPA
jgi:DNA-binding SARP family transcriptional activator